MAGRAFFVLLKRNRNGLIDAIRREERARFAAPHKDQPGGSCIGSPPYLRAIAGIKGCRQLDRITSYQNRRRASQRDFWKSYSRGEKFFATTSGCAGFTRCSGCVRARVSRKGGRESVSVNACFRAIRAGDTDSRPLGASPPPADLPRRFAAGYNGHSPAMPAGNQTLPEEWPHEARSHARPTVGRPTDSA